MIAITGGSGPLAEHLIQELLKRGKQLKVLHHQPDARDDENITWISGDIFDVTALEQLVDGVDEVYHLDGLNTFRRGVRSDLYRSNVEGTANVVDVSNSMGVGKLLYASTMYSLGDKCDNEPFDETVKWSDTKSASGFGWSMHLAEREVWRGVSEGLDAVVVHLPVVVGAPAEASSSAEILNYCITMNGGYPAGNVHLIDIGNAVAGIINCMDSGVINEDFILFSDMLTFKELKKKINRNFSGKGTGSEVSYSALARKAVFSRLNLLPGNNKPMISKSLARALSDTRRFSNKKISGILTSGFSEIDTSIDRYCSLFREGRKLK